MTFADLKAGDVFLMTWWLASGPTPRAYLVINRSIPTNERDVVLEIVRLEAAGERPTLARVSILEEAQEHGEIRLLEILPW